MSARQQKRVDPKTGKERVRWYIDVTFEHADGRVDRIRKDSPIQTKRGAEQYEQQVRAALLNGTYRKEEPKEVPTFAEFAKEFVSTYAVTNNKKTEVESKRRTLKNHLVPAFGKLRLDEIGPREIERFKSRKLADALSRKSVNNFLTILHKALVVAVEWGVIKAAPKVKWLRVPKQPFDFLSFDDAVRLVTAAAEEPEWATMITVGLKTGLRQGELLALRWEDVDLVAGRLVVNQNFAGGEVTTPKNGRTREIPLGDGVLAALKAHRHRRGELVFCGASGAMLTKGQCKHPLWRACKAAGLRRVGWHVLRHTFASHLAMKGVALKAIQELMGHSTIEMTMRYAHLSPHVARDAVRLLDGHVNVASTEGEDPPK